MSKYTLSSDKIGLILGPLLFILILVFAHPSDMPKEAVATLASAVWIAIWWTTEATPLAVTSLLPIVLFPLTGALDLSSTTAQFGHKFVFLYLGGFLIAIAIEKWNLHKRIALSIIDFIGIDVTKIILGFMIATAFLSMWISNTATSVMMLPIGMAILAQMKDDPKTVQDEHKIFGKALMLAIAYSASIGGISTLIGTPPNLVLAGIVKETYGIELTFTQWLKIGLPISMTLLFLSWFYLTTIAFKFKQKEFPTGRQEIKRLKNELGKIQGNESRVLIVFILAASLWISRSWLQNLLPAIDDTIIAIFCGILLFIIPSKTTKNKTILEWEDAKKIPWGIILLFGGGMALAQGFKASGLADYIGSSFSSFKDLMPMLLIIMIVFAVNFLTEVTSNLATTAMLLPVLATIAITVGVHPYMLLVPTTIAASCAFMLPVATPPNAVVFGSGYLRIPDMVKAGFWMNIASVLIISITLYFILPYFWDFEIAGTINN